jgi:hypothetical protein
MTSTPASPGPLAPDRASSRVRCCPAWTALAVWISFLAFSAVRTPVPAINEPHYLGKAKHFWNPQWCADDFFLESSDVHLVFYVAVGWLTKLLTLEQTAWIGRAAALLLLAWGWTRLAERVVAGRWAALWSAWIWLLLSAISDWSKSWAAGNGEGAVSLRIFDLSGEWIVGGVEAKVFAYGLLFWALSLAFERRWSAAAIRAGLSVSFHPVVGIWGIAAAALVGAVLCIRNAPAFGPKRLFESWFQTIRNIWRPVTAVLLLVVFSFPGLIPALSVLGGVSEETEFAADYLQVFYRLRHHLDPMQFPASAYASYGLLLAVWLVARRRSARTAQEPVFALFVTGALLIALAGLALGIAAPPLSQMRHYGLGIKLMKFYPFRLADVMVPIAASIALAGWIQRRITRDPGSTEHRSSVAAWLLLATTMLAALATPAYDANPSRMSPRQLADWTDVCRWIAAQTTRDALFLTPTQSWAFKWYAERPEYVAFKDCPQDAAGIVKWNRRLKYLRDWAQQHWTGGYTPDELRALHKQTGITHIVARRLGPFTIEPVYRNGSYRVYDLRPVVVDP